MKLIKLFRNQGGLIPIKYGLFFNNSKSIFTTPAYTYGRPPPSPPPTPPPTTKTASSESSAAAAPPSSSSSINTPPPPPPPKNKTNKMVFHVKISDIIQLTNGNCRMKNPERVEALINEFISGGHTKLQLVSDFDFTITKQRLSSGKKMISSFCILDRCPSMPQSVRDRNKELVKKYQPIEVDATIPIIDKIKVMEEWWIESSKSYQGYPMDKKEIFEGGKIHKDCLRDGTHELFNDLNALKVPILVFSAGIGDMVAAILEQTNVLMPTVKVVSNFLRWTDDGLCNGFDTDNMIHVFNKNEKVLAGTEYGDLVHDRTNIIVMGDSVGDAGMADGSPKSSNIIKIGFLFDNEEKNLPIYLDTFDIVLVDDQTMDVPRAIIENIIKRSEHTIHPNGEHETSVMPPPSISQ